jgi:hypothetical protein
MWCDATGFRAGDIEVGEFAESEEYGSDEAFKSVRARVSAAAGKLASSLVHHPILAL